MSRSHRLSTGAVVIGLAAGGCGVPYESVGGSKAPAAKPGHASHPAPAPARAPTDTPDLADSSYPAMAPHSLADDVDRAGAASGLSCVPSHPVDGWTEEDLERAVVDDLEGLGSISLGEPSGGRLLNARQLGEGPFWKVVDPEHAWGTEETLGYLTSAIEKVARRYPESHPLSIGHISAEHGGPLSPHVSHQSGRDVDLSYYYRENARWYARAHTGNLDVARTWELVRALITETDVDLILTDRSILSRLRKHAIDAGEDPGWVAAVFAGSPHRGAMVRHARGHATHLHVRFFNPVAQTTGHLTHDLLVKHGIVKTPVHTTRHTARRGDTLGKLARRYGTTIAALKQANGLRSSKIIAGRGYRVPQVHTTLPRPVFLPRLLPPAPSDSSGPADSPQRCPPLSRPSTAADPQGASRQSN